MDFAQPQWLFLLAAPPLVGLLVVTALLRQRGILARFGNLETVRRLSATASAYRRAVSVTLILLAWSFLVLALARPQWGRRAETVTRHGVDIMIVLDVSESMLAEDTPPSRLERARAVAADLVERLPGHRIGLVAMAGTAHVQCPLTLDQGAVRLFLDILEVGDVPDPGSDLAGGIEVAMDAFPEAATGTRIIVLLTDGEEHGGRGIEAARKAGEAGVIVYPLGIGTREGGPIPAPEAQASAGGYKKDRAGRVITTRLDIGHLEAMARAGRGEALAAGAPPDVSRLLAERIERMAGADLGSRILTTRMERFQVPLALAILCLLIEGVVPRARRASRIP